MPGRITFHTRPDGAGQSMKERLRIDRQGRVMIGSDAYIGGAALAVLGSGNTPNLYGSLAIGRVSANPTANTIISNIRLNGGSAGTGRGAEINAYADANWTDASSHPTYLTFGTVASGSTGATERMRIHAGGNVDIRTGNLVISTSGKGISFAATSGAAGMTSELLDDYEEGTFTPAVTSGLGAGQISYNSRSGKYTKVGNLVTFTFHMNINSATLDSGALKFGGLPFTTANVSHTAGGMWKIFTNGNIDANATYKVEGNSTDVQVVTGAGDAMAANATTINAGHRHMAYWGFYYV